MNIRKSALGFVMFFSLMPLCIFGVVSIYEMNRKIDSMTECNLRAVSENQITNIQKFAANRNSEMEKVASYDLTKEAIKYSLGESDETVDERYLDNLLEEQKKELEADLEQAIQKGRRCGISDEDIKSLFELILEG